jgi:glutathione S-transferase
MMELAVFDDCPFCYRCLLVLLEKKTPFKLLRIERSKKKESARLLSPYERVPVLWHDGRPVYESSIINEYLEEVLPGPSLLPQDAGQRALARFWIDFCNTRFMPTYFNLLKERDPAQRAPFKQALAGHLQFIESVGLAKVSVTEPYWIGSDMSLADAAFYPFFEYFVSVEVYRGVPLPNDLEQVVTWLGAMRARDSVKQLMRSREYHIERFGKIYADK